MSTVTERAIWAQSTQIKANIARREERLALYDEIDRLHDEIEEWRKLCIEIIRERR